MSKQRHESTSNRAALAGGDGYQVLATKRRLRWAPLFWLLLLLSGCERSTDTVRLTPQTASSPRAAKNTDSDATFRDPPTRFPAVPRIVAFGDVHGWGFIGTAADAQAVARCKILAAETLAEAAPEAEFSLWLDPDRLLVGNLETLIARWTAGRDFALWRHPHSTDWSDLAERHLVHGAASPETIVAQAAGCDVDGVPRHAGCFDTGLLWRRHGAEGVGALMRRWWEIERAAPGVDDLSLLRALHGAGAAPLVMPAALGSAEDNLFAARQTRRPVAAPRAKALAAPGVKRARAPLTFVYSTKLPNSTTTLLRGKQLSEIVAAHYGDLYDVSYVPDIDAPRDQVVLVTKEALWHNKTPKLEALKARNLAMIGSWEDGQPDPEKTPLLDAMMTLSIRGMLDVNRGWPNVPAFHVTHNVNSAVPFLTPPMDRLRTGYFGDLPNTVRPESLADDVDLVNADSIGLRAKGISTDWLQALPHYNCHWIVRNRRPLDGWKPFLKGFVAARCGAVVIVTRDDQNAAHYLGDDYPFYAESVGAADLEMAWANAASAFGGPEWRFAQDIMRQVGERSADSQVAAEFKAMMDAVLG